MKICAYIILTFGFMIFMIGCDGSGGQVVPDIHSDTTPPQNSIGRDTDGMSPHRLTGYYRLIIDTSSGNIEVVPMKTAELRINLVGILNSTMGVTAAGAPADSDPANGIFA